MAFAREGREVVMASISWGQLNEDEKTTCFQNTGNQAVTAALCISK